MADPNADLALRTESQRKKDFADGSILAKEIERQRQARAEKAIEDPARRLEAAQGIVELMAKNGTIDPLDLRGQVERRDALIANVSELARLQRAAKRASEAEWRTRELEIRTEAVNQENARLEAAEQAHALASAKAAVSKMIGNGKLDGLDSARVQEYLERFTRDPELIALIAGK